MKNLSIQQITRYIASLFFYTCYIHADQIAIMNLTAQQVTVIVQTANKTTSAQAVPNENLYVQQNLDTQFNQYDNKLTSLVYDRSKIKKIMIQRATTNMPQIIYYNNEMTFDNKNNASGIYGMMVTQPVTMQVSQDSVTINNLVYDMLDLSSYIAACNHLKSTLTMDNANALQQDIQDITQSLQAVQNSDKSQQLIAQTTAIQSAVNWLNNALQMIQEFAKYMQSIQLLSQQLNLTNVENTQQQIYALTAAMQTFNQSDMKNILQPQNAQNQLNDLQSKITDLQRHLQATNPITIVPTPAGT